MASQGILLCSLEEIFGAASPDARTASPRNWRRASSMPRLLSSNTKVFTSKSVGSFTGIQSLTSKFVCGSSVGSPCRTIYALVKRYEQHEDRNQQHQQSEARPAQPCGVIGHSGPGPIIPATGKHWR